MVKTEKKLHKNSRSGFTLLELLVVVGILAALVALALPFYQDYVNQSKLTAAEADLQTFKKALAMYDQMESKLFSGTDLTKLIGKYLQDYRTFTGQVNPVDPWGNDYVIIPQEGVVMSKGPDGAAQTTARIVQGDDLIATWKPPFFVAGARGVNQNTIEVSFSRKINDSTGVTSIAFAPTATNALGNMTVSAKLVQKVSDTVYRISLDTSMVKGRKYNVTVSQRVSQDGKSSYDANPDGTDNTGSLAICDY